MLLTHFQEENKELKGHSQLCDRADLDTSFLTLKRFHLYLISKDMRQEIHFNLHSVLLDFQPVFECASVHPVIIFYHISWYLMRMCVS